MDIDKLAARAPLKYRQYECPATNDTTDWVEDFEGKEIPEMDFEVFDDWPSGVKIVNAYAKMKADRDRLDHYRILVDMLIERYDPLESFDEMDLHAEARTIDEAAGPHSRVRELVKFILDGVRGGRDRDALAECVKAADEVRDCFDYDPADGYYNNCRYDTGKAIEDYIAARAKVKP